ncbi:hypothetical protein DSCO28_16160 [Desulfosarcina ovata subsp. sediminis]|uniref:Transposase IS4-like domain-containing protein n=1 Tax=Desulfosarcina ovata subsp. sediminis TaxID=885957 RepID=A0A5K7ZPR3_9BACT|nr:hypothetical protein [Desulfosarcina ovata]BBO81050.1 hypothetical protein DSCO28_16160 [Desulfosarcina ovata subsp. sediminis]
MALYSTDPSLSTGQIIEYYGARWKIEALFKEFKHNIGSADTQTRHPQAVDGRRHFAFSDVRLSVAKAAMGKDFGRLFPAPNPNPSLILSGTYYCAWQRN